jgi:long-chain acyl-CoA synthetase
VLYYTSGTTGQPSGAIFQHAQLRWLAETLASMYPWRERNRWGSYLSYLPMNHVVEGVLASFSPYYVPAALDIYFLEEFDGLPQALTRVRPTIFFSVPRFFEKVRAKAMESPLIRAYVKLSPGDWRSRLLSSLLRRGLLRKAGLDGARMLIVGSAQSDPEVLAFFHELGVEVHDAYGLTEAPLITLNRLGRNRVGTLGEPLPDTELRIGEDGEIFVRGPQTAAGYIENGDLSDIIPFPNGWLATGDLGHINEDGFLEINGRKKDLIITSYGKKIFPARIESCLRAIPGIVEAVLVGDGRPYCAALLWMESGVWDSDCAAQVEAGMVEVNAHLSHAEQIKRWAVLPGSPTVANGDLTGSLKLKRGLVVERLASLIGALYRGETPAGVLLCGSMPVDHISLE